jgi:heptosyltransferase-2
VVAAKFRLESELSNTRPLLGLNPGAEYGPAKRWPAESFAAVAREVSRKHGNCAWLAFGGAGDWQLCSDIARLAGGGVVNLAGKTSLRQLMALLKLCRVLLTNDSGPMHVAAALGTRVVVSFGSTAPVLTGPGLPGDARHQLLQAAAPCSPCFRRVCPIDFRCMTGISPARVVEAVSQAITLG